MGEPDDFEAAMDRIFALTAERDEARQWAEAAAADENANAAELRTAKHTIGAMGQTLDEIRDALGNGADESAWPPGASLAEAVAKMRATLDAVAAYADYLADPPTFTGTPSNNRMLGGPRVKIADELRDIILGGSRE